MLVSPRAILWIGLLLSITAVVGLYLEGGLGTSFAGAGAVEPHVPDRADSTLEREHRKVADRVPVSGEPGVHAAASKSRSARVRIMHPGGVPAVGVPVLYVEQSAKTLERVERHKEELVQLEGRPFAILGVIGRKSQSDDDGYATLALASDDAPVQLMVQAGKFEGRAMLTAGEVDGHILELQAGGAVTVRCVPPPVDALPLALWWDPPPSVSPSPVRHILGVTDANGTLTIESMVYHTDPIRMMGGDLNSMRIAVDLPGCRGRAQPLSLDHNDVEVVVPPLGMLQVELADSNLDPGMAGSVLVQSSIDVGLEAWASPARHVVGKPVRVGLGGTLTIAYQDRTGRCQTEISAPTRAGDTVVARLHRWADATDASLMSVLVVADLGPDSSDAIDLRCEHTAADGIVQTLWTEPVPKSSLSERRLSRRLARSRLAAGEWLTLRDRARGLNARHRLVVPEDSGVVDLGAVAWRRFPHATQLVVLDTNGGEVEEAEVKLLSGESNALLSRDATGLLIERESIEIPVSARVSKAGFVPASAVVPMVPVFEVRLQPAMHVVCTVRTDATISTGRIYVVISAPHPGTSLGPTAWWPQVVRRTAGEQVFEWSDVPQEDCRVVCLALNAPAVLADQHLVVSGQEERASKVVDIDLRGKVRELRVSGRDASGRELELGGWIGMYRSHDQRWYFARLEAWRWIVQREAREALVVLPGRLAERVRLDGPEIPMTARQAFMARFVCADGVDLAAIESIEVQNVSDFIPLGTEVVKWLPSGTSVSAKDMRLSGERVQLRNLLSVPALPNQAGVWSTQVKGIYVVNCRPGFRCNPPTFDTEHGQDVLRIERDERR